ncbi:DUF4232 domain-containing protein [Streptomyces albiflaviniger]|nr:DUF4232 domain-containing protein [Streptomyces albiflaviniger]
MPPIPFDPLRYGIPPASLGSIEPVQLLALEAARRALDDAGYGDPCDGGRTFDRSRTSVVFGAEAGSASGGSSSASRCTTGHLEAAWSNFEGGPDMTYDRQQTARVVLKNTGSSDCTMVGFPGVQLQTEHGETWDLRRTDDKPKPVRVAAGGRVTFDITFLASTRDDDKKFAPDQVVITPPNDRRNISLDWPYGGALLDQPGATHPGTFVGPVSTPE